jgi:hypothetical protein
LTGAQWDAPEILLDSALTTLRRLGWHAGDSVYVVIDDTQKKKRGKKMDAVSKIFLHAEKVYGVYDMLHNQGWVNVGIDHDTAQFAANSIRRWWNEMGQQRFPAPSHQIADNSHGIDPIHSPDKGPAQWP